MSTSWPALRSFWRPESAISSVTRTRATEYLSVENDRLKGAEVGSVRRDERLQTLKPLDQVVVTQGVAQPEKSRRTKGFARHDGDLDRVEEQLSEFRGGVRHAPVERAAEQ